jgi:hypothetical protein
MNLANIISEIDQEIARLQQAKAILSGGSTRKGPGRPRGAASKPDGIQPKAKARRRISAAGRAKIAAAQKARWAKLKKAQKPEAGK